MLGQGHLKYLLDCNGTLVCTPIKHKHPHINFNASTNLCAAAKMANSLWTSVVLVRKHSEESADTLQLSIHTVSACTCYSQAILAAKGIIQLLFATAVCICVQKAFKAYDRNHT